MGDERADAPCIDFAMSAPAKQNIVQIRAMSGHFWADFPLVKLPASHGRSPYSMSDKALAS